jgi:hypothetical protein
MACLHAQDRQRFKVVHDHFVPEGGCEEPWRHAVDSILAITQTPTRRNKTGTRRAIPIRGSQVLYHSTCRRLGSCLYRSIVRQ